MKRTPLKRKTPLQTKPLRPRCQRQNASKKRSNQARAREFSPAIKGIVFERSEGMCELCRMRPIIEYHHAIYRSQLGTGELSNCIGLCKVCHDVIHHDGNASKYFRDMCETKAKELAGVYESGQPVNA